MPAEVVHQVLTRRYELLLAERGQSGIDKVAQANITAVTHWLTDNSCKPGLLLYGGVGNGKTTLAKAICDSLQFIKRSCDKYERDWKKPVTSREVEKEKEEMSKQIAIFKASVPYTKAFTAVAIAKRMEQDSENLDYELWKETDERGIPLDPVTYKPLYKRQERLLFIDDLGCEPAVVKVYGTETTPLADVISKCYSRQVPVIITTNLDLRDIEDRYGLRVSDRLREMCETIGFTAKSYRK